MYGMGVDAVEWFKNYLSDRMQYAKVNNCISSSLPTVCGVQQGSILGTLLFIICINDITKCLTECSAKLYADDMAILANGTDYIDIMLSLQIEMANVIEWLRLNKLTLNVKKTKFMLCGTPQKLNKITHLPLIMNNEEVE